MININNLCLSGTYIAVSTSLFQVPQLRKILLLPKASAIKLDLSCFPPTGTENKTCVYKVLN